MDYHEFITEASQVSAGEPLDKIIRVKGDVSGQLEVVCGYFSPSDVPVGKEGLPTQFILSASGITVEEFYNFSHGHLDSNREKVVEWTVKEMIAGVIARLEEVTGRSSVSPLENVFTIQAAANYWSRTQDAVSKWVHRRTFDEHEMKQVGGIWLITRSGMVRRTGEFGGGRHIIYSATNRKTREVYVGCTNRTLESERRWFEKKGKQHPNAKLAEAIKKYKIKGFEWQVLGYYDSKEEAESDMPRWIEETNASEGYNPPS